MPRKFRVSKRHQLLTSKSVFKSRTTPRPLSKKFFLLLIGLLILVGVSAGFVNKPWVVKAVEIYINGVGCVSKEDLEPKLTFKSENILTLKTSSVEKEIKNRHLCIKEVKIDKEFPGKVSVHLAGRQKVATVLPFMPTKESTDSATLTVFIQDASKADYLASSSASFLVDVEGVIFAANDGNMDGLKIFSQGVELGVRWDRQLMPRILQVLRGLNEFAVSANEVFLYKDNSFLVKARPLILFNIEKKVDEQLASLQLILEKAKIEGENIEIIDLRFDKPVIRYTNRKE